MLSKDPYKSRVHLVPLGVVSSDRLKGYVDRWKGYYTHAIAFRPTGWTYAPPAGSDSIPTLANVLAKACAKTYTANDMRPMRNSTRDMQLYGVPYSEHSSFAELTCFALSFDWGRMIATVNGTCSTYRIWWKGICAHTFISYSGYRELTEEDGSLD
jgi:DNA cross-link repair 1A protein